MVIFGASGDLTKRKLIPSLHNLRREGWLPHHFVAVLVARAPMSDEEARAKFVADLDEFATAPVTDEDRKWFTSRVHYVSGTFETDDLYGRLAETLGKHDQSGNHLYYLATPPDFFGPITEQLGRAGLLREDRGFRRVVYEKPFGHDLASAQELNRRIQAELREHQIYRIDHYLGKETVQNVLIFRFANGIFEPIWNRRYVDHVQITVAETVGVEGRGGYYDRAGALRDMVPNHLFQLLAITAMEPPNSFNPEAVRDERLKVLEAIRPLSLDEVARCAARGQYGEGVEKGKVLPAYRDEPKVDPRSATETFVALRLALDNWRWADVPFYLRTGKRLPQAGLGDRDSVQVRPDHDVPRHRRQAHRSEPAHRPDPAGRRHLAAVWRQGPRSRARHWDGADGLQVHATTSAPRRRTGYETLIYDCMTGDATLFHRADMVETSWRRVVPILERWSDEEPNFPNYASMTWGPDEAVELMARDGRSWRRP